MYLAGGFSQRYPEYLDELFVKEFLKHGSVYYQKILKKIPIYLIKNNDVSLLGAGYAGTML
ncbi:glucokinase [Candidatus Woesearchaeota archaeon]|nr:glucokinase [Candidatus Woesearchaeota archaeon]